VLDSRNSVSAISKLEVLGYPRLLETGRHYFENVFKILNILPISDAVIDKAIELRQLFKMKSNDSIILATALLNDLVVYTRNVDDFKSITGLKVINPVAQFP